MSDAWRDFWDEARVADIREVAERLHVTLKKHGRDFSGPCPAGCADTDGFVITPSKNVFVCRPSGVGGGVVELVVHAQCCSNVEAAEFILGRDRPDRSLDETDEQKAQREERKRQREAAAKAREAREAKAAAARRRRDEEHVDAVTRRMEPIVDSYGAEYLIGRRINLPERMLEDLYYVEELDYFGHTRDKEPGEKADPPFEHLLTCPAMIAIIRGVGDEVLGLHCTYLDPKFPRKLKPPGASTNKAKKFRKRGETLAGGMIRLGPLGQRMAIGEGIETVSSWWHLGLGPEDITLGVAMSLQNLTGRCLGTLPHPTKKNATIPNGIPDPNDGGVILPRFVKEVILLVDGDSDEHTLAGGVLGQYRRWTAQGRTVSIHNAPRGYDFNDVLVRRWEAQAAFDHRDLPAAGEGIEAPLPEYAE